MTILSLLTNKRSEQELDNLLSNPYNTDEDADACVPYEFHHTDGNANDETNHDAEDCNVNADKYSKSHDFLSLMVTDMFLKLAYL